MQKVLLIPWSHAWKHDTVCDTRLVFLRTYIKNVPQTFRLVKQITDQPGDNPSKKSNIHYLHNATVLDIF